MDLYPGLLLEKKTSGRIAQVSGLDDQYVYLCWDDNGVQTRVRRKRFNRTSEWGEVVYLEHA
jgi:hypothetical protein